MSISHGQPSADADLIVNRIPSPTSIPTIRPDLTKSPPRAGISHLSFDTEATLLLVRLDTHPHVLHIYSFLPNPTSASPEITHLAALIFTETIKTARWCPGRRKVAISTKGGDIYFWDCDEGWIEDTAVDESGDIKGGMVEGIGIPTREYSLQVLGLKTSRDRVYSYRWSMVA